jgi:GxxExxY protein
VRGISQDILADRTCAETIDSAFAVHRALGGLHAPDTYLRALVVELGARGIPVHRGATFSVVYREKIVGNFASDLLVDERVVVRVVADPALYLEHKTEMVRGLSAGGVRLGLVFNFGVGDLQFARIL